MAHRTSTFTFLAGLMGLGLATGLGCGENSAKPPLGNENGLAGSQGGTGGAGGGLGGTGGAGSGQSGVGGAGSGQSGIGGGAGQGAGASTQQGGGSGSPVFRGVPAVGDSVSAADAGSPAGTVVSVTTTNSTYHYVSVTYPASWTCPGTGSTTTPPPQSVTNQDSDPSLSATDCHGLAALRRPALKAQSRSQLENARSSLIRYNCNPQTLSFCLDSDGTVVSSSSCYGYGYAADGGTVMVGAMPANATSGDAKNGATQYSTTNNQVATVDEADYVKNDANTIFVLGTDGLHVIDAWPAAETHEIAMVKLPGEPRRLFLEQNRLVVYTRMQATTATGYGAGTSNPSDQGCTYGYGCRFTSEGGHTLALVYDVTTPSAPRELVRFEFSGGYVASRRVGAFVYTVVHDTGAPQIPGLDYTLTADSYEALQTAFAARAAANEAAIDNTPDSFFLPWFRTTTPDGNVASASSCDRALAAMQAEGMSFVSLNAFDLTTLTPPKRTVLGSNPGFVYASPTSLYLAVDKSAEPTSVSGYSSYSYNATSSVVHKFAMEGTDTRYIGSANLPGHILNQFAMDEYSGVLRVASTAGWDPDPGVVSYVTTFGESSGKFAQIGQVGGIAPTEDIRSVRFDTDRGYVVTFKKTDPLFIFDLADPAAPKMLGELKIPGFSTYMQRLDAGHLLAIGFDADDQGSFAWFNGIQIQIFDVTDLANPQLMWKQVIGTRGSGSEALTNHLAFNYFAPKKMLAIPMTVCEGGGNGVYGDKLTFAGLMAFDISLESGITEHGRLPFLDPTAVSTTDTCMKWWTDSSSLVKRSIFMDDWIYGLSDAQLRVAGLASMSQPVQTLSLSGK